MSRIREEARVIEALALDQLREVLIDYDPESEPADLCAQRVMALPAIRAAFSVRNALAELIALHDGAA